MTLEQAAGAKGIPVQVLLDALRPAATTAASDGPGPADSVRSILAAYPQTALVFARHGLAGCGGQAGPDERLDVFAAAHRVEVSGLIGELREAIRCRSAAVPVPVPVHRGAAPAQERPLFPAFLRAALACTLTLGASFGAYNLLVIHWVLGESPPSHNWVHAGFQIWGFVFLFIVGVSTHTFPRFVGEPLAYPRGMRSVLWLTLASQLLLGWSRFGDRLPWTVAAASGGALLQLGAVALWAASLVVTWRRSSAPFEIYHAFLTVGTLGWFAAAAALGGGAAAAIREQDAEAAIGWNQAVYAAALFGGALMWIEGFFLRVGQVFLGSPAPRRGWVVASLVLAPLGVASVAAGSLRLGRPGGLALMDAGLLAVALSAGAFLIGARPFSGAPRGDGREAKAFREGARCAFAAALLFAVLAATYAVWNLADGSAPGLLYDGARHAFTVGFVTLLILAFAGRVIPVFSGADLHRPELWTWGMRLVAASVLLREMQVFAGILGVQTFLRISGTSGVVAAAGVACAAVSILGTMRAGIRTARRVASPQTVPVSADVKILDLVEAHPESLPLLIEAGFAPLANPVLRRMMGSLVTLRKACSMHGVEVNALVDRLRRACPHGSPRGAEPLDRLVVLRLLHAVTDPDLGESIVDLGLVYDVDVHPGGRVLVRMTLTAPACPHREVLLERARVAVRAHPDVREVELDLVFEPPWTPERMAAPLRARLGVT